MSDPAAPSGPVQLLVLGLTGDRFTDEVVPELTRLRDADGVRLLDLLLVTKDAGGAIEVAQAGGARGALVGALVGLGPDGEEVFERALDVPDGPGADADVWYLADAVPNGSSAAVALLEHRWAIPLRERIAGAGGVALADEWVHPDDLSAARAAAG